MTPDSPYKDKFFSILGDSVSTLEGYNPPNYAVYYDWINQRKTGVFTPEDTWWGLVIDALGGRCLINNSFSGSFVCRLPEFEIESYGCSDERTERLGFDALTPDVIMILIGLNDFGGGRPIYPTDKENGLSVFSVAYETMLNKIKTNYPKAEIWCLTLPLGYQSESTEQVTPSRYFVRPIEDYNQVIRACGEKLNCKIIEIYHPENPYDSVDGYHPNANGMKTIADTVLREVAKEIVSADD